MQDQRETGSFARRVFSLIGTGRSIGLVGELGAGKTTFVKYLAEAAGLRRDEVSSPSFVLEQEYSGAGVVIEHWDLYRLGDAPEELFEQVDSRTLRIIEWPDRSPELMNGLDLVLTFSFAADREKRPDERRVRISGPLAKLF